MLAIGADALPAFLAGGAGFISRELVRCSLSMSSASAFAGDFPLTL